MPVSLSRALFDLGLDEHLAAFSGAGYSSWEKLTTITEQELAALNIRPGNRRKLQRAIARSLNWPDNRPLPSAAELDRFRRS
ncbi:unnamed protein product [Blumeria hordei]|uniref:SAM domain-containing protein n=1 Tax=Blumeria hordei TaxID=2867405 RepID=A0A383V0W1_BLUHO|nr:unnamed protein product [Blumeria hordei]